MGSGYTKKPESDAKPSFGDVVPAPEPNEATEKAKKEPEPNEAATITTSPGRAATKGKPANLAPRQQRQLQEAVPAQAAAPTAGSSSSGAEVVPEQGAAAQEKPAETGEEPWRCKRIGRGVPKDDPNRPWTQDVANTDLDTARLLKERGNIAEVPDLPEENQLKRLLAKKAEWLYSPKDSLVLNAKRNTINQMNTAQTKTQSWTKAGRLVCDVGNRPPVQNAPFPQELPPYLLKQRMPMTRTEVTEQRIIGNASLPPAPPPQFTIEAKGGLGYLGSERRSSRPLSARGSDGRRNSASSDITSAGRVLVESPRAPPLTAR